MRRELFIKEKEQNKSDIRILACFSYAKLFYQEGNFRKTKDILYKILIQNQKLLHYFRM